MCRRGETQGDDTEQKLAVAGAASQYFQNDVGSAFRVLSGNDEFGARALPRWQRRRTKNFAREAWLFFTRAVAALELFGDDFPENGSGDRAIEEVAEVPHKREHIGRDLGICHATRQRQLITRVRLPHEG